MSVAKRIIEEELALYSDENDKYDFDDFYGCDYWFPSTHEVMDRLHEEGDIASRYALKDVFTKAKIFTEEESLLNRIQKKVKEEDNG